MATVTYKCPSCGGGLQFDPTAQKYKCDYCLSEFTQAELEQMTPHKAADQTAPDVQAEAPNETSSAVLYTCPSCGAEIVTDETTAASFCYYCHNPVVLAGRLEGDFHPDFVLPFAIDKTKAVEIFNGWMKKKKYVPKAFYSKEQLEKITGVYFPYWLYSCEVDGKLDAEGTKNRIWVVGNIQYTETQKYDVSREGNMKINNVTRNALKKANRQLVEGVLPFQLESLQPFSMGYLSGFSAEKRDMEQQDFMTEVEEEVQDFASGSLRSSINGYDGITVRESKADIMTPEWKYALLPVWTLTYNDKKKNKIYYFALNGQNGKICGELPVDTTRLAVLFASIFIPMMIVLLIAGYFI